MEQLRTRLTYANVMSTIAVFLVLGGATAIAASQLAKNSVGKKQLKPNSVTVTKIKKNAVIGKKIAKNAVTGSKVKDASLTGADINLSSLGTVPSAAVANSLATMSALKQTKVNSSASATPLATAAAEATAVTLYEDSHFRVYGKCYIDTAGPTLWANTYIATKQDGAIYDGLSDELSGSAPNGYLNTATAEDLREIYNQQAAANTAFIAEASDFGATAADGYSLFGILQVSAKHGTIAGGDGIYGAGDVCLFTGYFNHS